MFRKPCEPYAGDNRNPILSALFATAPSAAYGGTAEEEQHGAAQGRAPTATRRRRLRGRGLVLWGFYFVILFAKDTQWGNQGDTASTEDPPAPDVWFPSQSFEIVFRMNSPIPELVYLNLDSFVVHRARVNLAIVCA